MTRQTIILLPLRIFVICLTWLLLAPLMVGLVYVFSPMWDGHYHLHDSVVFGCAFSALSLTFTQITSHKRDQAVKPVLREIE